jgi:acetyl-CoA carboxylase carboxyl transferase subunit alpha
LMLEKSVYAVIPPEGCAAILWKDSGQAVRAAESLKLTAKDLLELQIIDQIVAEPNGGAQVSVDETAALLNVALSESLTQVLSMSAEERLRRRYTKLRALGF